MQLATASSLVRSSGVVERSQSRVNMNATAFKILSSGLYSDKIGAVLREIGCNAADAHIMVGTPDRPFQVKLPTPLDPTFAIKDWGPGLSHEDVMNNYQTYFHSTKTHTNEVTGCFGLGSKSPYAYTDQFTVKSVQDGVMRVYFCAFDETGVPTTSLVGTEPAPDDWTHGLEVSLPVKAGDQTTFQQKAQDIFRWFRVTPKVTGGNAVTPIEYEWRVGRFKRPKDRGTHSIYEPKLVMGNVAYDFDTSALRNAAFNRGTAWLAYVVGWMYQQDIFFEVPIGTVDITASREKVEMTDRTIDKLLELISDEVKALAATVTEYLDAHPNLTTGTIDGLIDELAKNAHVSVLSDLREGIGRFLSDDHRAQFESAMSGQVEVSGWHDLVRKFADDMRPLPYGTQWLWDNDRRRSRVFTGVIPTNNKTVVLVNDRPKRAADRIKHLMAGDRTLNVLTFSHAEPGVWQQIADLLDQNEVPVDYRLLSTLPKPPPKVKGAAGHVLRRKGDDKLLNMWDTSADNYGYEPPEGAIKDIPDDSRYYVVRMCGGWGQRWLAVPNQHKAHPRYYFGALRTLRKLGLPCPSHIAVVTEGQVAKLKLAEFGFQPLSDWVRDVLEKEQRVIDFREKAQLQISVQLANYGVTSLTRSLFDLCRSKKPQWSVIAKALEGSQYLDDLVNLVDDYEEKFELALGEGKQAPPSHAGALEQLGYKSQPRYESFNFDTKIKALHERHPKLAVLDNQLVYQAGVFDFQVMALAMAVSPSNPVIVPTAEEA